MNLTNTICLFLNALVQPPLSVGSCLLPAPALGSPAGVGAPMPPVPSAAPCSTLFVANLGQFVSEHELKEIFSSCAGFSRLRMLAKQPGGAQTPVAFIEFQDVQSAANAMASLQGTFLLSSDRGAIRIEYAKSKMAATEGAAYHNGWHHIASLEGPKIGEESEQH